MAGFRHKLGTLGGWRGLVACEHMFATLEGTVDQVLERRREGRRREVRAIGEQQARLAQRLTRDRARGRRRGGLARGGVLLERAVAGADLEQRPPHREAHHAHQRCAARLARPRPRAQHRGADPRSGGSRRRVRDSRERCGARARGARQGAQCDRAGRSHARSADGGGRPGAVRASLAEHDLDARPARACASAGGYRWSRAQPSSKPSGTSPSRSAHSTSKPARTLEWQQYTADALASLARCGGTESDIRRSPTTLIVHLSDDAPPLLEGAGPISPETAERLACDARRLTIKPTAATSSTPASDAAPPTPNNAHCTNAQTATANTPAAAPPTNSKPTTSPPPSTAAKQNSTTSSCSAPATTNTSTTTTSTPAVTANTPPSPTKPDAPSPPTSHTHHPADRRKDSRRTDTLRVDV